MGENVLIASLGESPVVVTAMFDLLTTEEKQREIGEIKKVLVLRPSPKDNDDDIGLGYDLIAEALQGKCELLSELLPFEDANGEDESFDFLKHLYRLLDTHQKSGDTLYLSLAGGRKNMSALMALLVPLFPCVKKLYHVLDTDEKQFKSTEAIISLSEADRKAYMHPPLERLKLIDIPYGERQQSSLQFRSLLFDLTPEQLEALWEQNPALAEMMQFYGGVSRQRETASTNQPDITGNILRVFVTEHVRERYKAMQDRDATRASRFADFFRQMRYADTLADKKLHLHGYIEGISPEGKPMLFHYFKRRRTAERPFYYTWPEGIHRYPHADVRKVIICDLAIEQDDGSYDPPAEVSLQAAREATKTYTVETLLSSGIDSVLLVPLGTSPMVATQLYALLKEQGHNIHKVVLLYPGRSNIVKASARLVREALEDEGVPYRDIPIKGLEDIASREDCMTYGKALEDAIIAIRREYSNCEIALALSGGRKGMAALAMFAAQRQGIQYLYHTLINNEELEKRVEAKKTGATIEVLNGEDRDVRRERMFLRAYGGPEAGFVLFKVPVIPTERVESSNE
jgi:CRISPR-associated Csx14 family protein